MCEFVVNIINFHKDRFTDIITIRSRLFYLKIYGLFYFIINSPTLAFPSNFDFFFKLLSCLKAQNEQFYVRCQAYLNDIEDFI